ncbi:hypothetical protein PsorP6_002975 [Peronosclerospora sorghi]|uniref:Uncharacterized protein n=1 Tax=Peronosclerospora sorghi TaxID=230839 RepID=A0ACC0VIR8_9STRA|nr:hypothetical protein PsorP6_002975 [Peronosclerospora sorghi]
MNKQHLLTEQFKDAIQRLQQTGLSLTGSGRKVLVGSSELPPIKFDELTAKDFMTWIVSLTKKDGERPGTLPSTLIVMLCSTSSAITVGLC